MPVHALDGVRVLDLSRVLAGPLCCMMLGDHGADVIKVEPPEGDETRTWGPPFIDGQSAYYLNINRNKRGIVLNLAMADGQEVIRRLVMTSDVLVENFKTGTMERWGLHYEELHTLNPRLIYASISGFGRDGPYANVSGYDAVLQAMGGFMSINGEPDGQPLKAPVAIADLATGFFANQAILLALYHRERTGLGQSVEASLLHSTLSLLHPHNSAYLNAGVVPKPHGNTAPMISPYDLLQATDRPVYLPGGNDGQVRRLLEAIGRADLIDDPRFRTNQDRVKHRAELLRLVGAEIRKKTAAEWCHVLWAVSVPFGPVNTLPEVFDDPQVVHSGLVVETPHPAFRSAKLRTIKPGATLHGTPGGVRRPPPLLGQHTQEVMAEIGLLAAQVSDGAGR
jgi:crotonobetainyl-CoA:carnitine CoA-transferase CaiB-like acyl-CoA transferase